MFLVDKLKKKKHEHGEFAYLVISVYKNNLYKNNETRNALSADLVQSSVNMCEIFDGTRVILNSMLLERGIELHVPYRPRLITPLLDHLFEHFGPYS